MPTLLTRTSSPPSAAAASATTRSGSPARERSATTCAASPTRGASRRPHETTRAPSPASWRTTSSPIPPVEPVTRHLVPFKPRSMSGLGYPRADDDRPGQARRDRLESRQPLPGARGSSAQRHRPGAGARAREGAAGRDVRGALHEPASARERDGRDPRLASSGSSRSPRRR